MKTLRTVLLALVVLSVAHLWTPGLAFGQQGPTVSITSGEIPEGGTEVTTLWALDVGDPSLCGFTIDIVYDPLVNTATYCDADPEDNFGARLCNADYAPNTIRVVGADPWGLADDIPLADITWTAVGTAGDSTHLDVQIVSFVDCQQAPLEIPGVRDQDGVNVIIGPPVTAVAPPLTGAGGSATTSDSAWSTLCAAGGALVLLLGALAMLPLPGRKH